MSSRKKSVIEPTAGGNAIIAAWRGLYNFFGARAEFEVTPEGVRVIGLKFSNEYENEPIVQDLVSKASPKNRINLLPAHLYIMGQEPEPFTNAVEMTNWMVTYLKGAGGNENRSPQYAKNAIEAYKAKNGLSVPRGRPRKTFSIENLGKLNQGILADVPAEELENLLAAVNSALEKQSQPEPA